MSNYVGLQIDCTGDRPVLHTDGVERVDVLTLIAWCWANEPQLIVTGLQMTFGLAAPVGKEYLN